MTSWLAAWCSDPFAALAAGQESLETYAPRLAGALVNAVLPDAAFAEENAVTIEYNADWCLGLTGRKRCAHMAQPHRPPSHETWAMAAALSPAALPERCLCMVVLEEESLVRLAAGVPDPEAVAEMAGLFSRAWKPSDIDADFRNRWAGISLTQSWLFADTACLQETQNMQFVGTRGWQDDLARLAKECSVELGEEWEVVTGQGVSTDPGPIQERMPRVAMKPCRVGAFIRKIPARWQTVMHEPAAMETIQRWAHSAGRKDNVRALQLFQEWVSERITDTVRCCEPQDVMQMPLVFRDKRSFTMDLLDENRRPDPPSPDFCVNHDLKGTFFALDFPVLSTWDSPQDMTIRYHGTNLYALSAAMAAGILVRAQEGRLCCTAGAVARPPPQPGIA